MATYVRCLTLIASASGTFKENQVIEVTDENEATLADWEKNGLVEEYDPSASEVTKEELATLPGKSPQKVKQNAQTKNRRRRGSGQQKGRKAQGVIEHNDGDDDGSDEDAEQVSGTNEGADDGSAGDEDADSND